ncbi:MAG: hypothetical protein AAF004_01060 [Pseudomonadota bacterium]
MTAYSAMLFFHILLLVFWLGTDLGVFLAAKISEKGTLSAETRATVLQLGMVLDRLPRSALTLILPSGVQLAVLGGYLQAPGALPLVLWIAGFVWLGILWSGFLNPETPTEKRAMLINFVLNAVLALTVTTAGIWLLLGDQVADWLAGKVLLVGLVFVCGVALDILFKPAVGTFVSIMTEGATDEKNTAYSKQLAPVYWVVIAIYVLVLLATWLGISKTL